jgi:hypothetical protein
MVFIKYIYFFILTIPSYAIAELYFVNDGSVDLLIVDTMNKKSIVVDIGKTVSIAKAEQVNSFVFEKNSGNNISQQAIVSFYGKSKENSDLYVVMSKLINGNVPDKIHIIKGTLTKKRALALISRKYGCSKCAAKALR